MNDSGNGDHETRVRDAFDSLHRNIGERLDGSARTSFDGLRDAAERRDRESLRRELTAVQEKHGWLYRELAEHPVLSNLLNELALWGF
ncbi:MAG TPA: hypothetical protein VIZ58_03670 [Thermoanaerobaculia bacterium]